MTRSKYIILLLCLFQIAWNQDAYGQRRSKVPILVLYSQDDFGRYTGEILKTEGYSEFELRDLDSSNISLKQLKAFDLVILAAKKLTAPQSALFEQYVGQGGNLIAFKPDPILQQVFGVKYLDAISTEGYVAIDSTTHIGRGITSQRFSIHSKTDKCVLTNASSLASFFSNRSDAESSPAIVLNKHGRGQALAFLYDLPENIIYTRQGNAEYAGKETDGITGIRAMDLFTNGWVDSVDNLLNHADEQMRLLTHSIEYLNGANKPLPRLWYFPGKLKSLITLNNDGEDSKEAEFEPQFEDVYAKGARMTLYIKETDLVSKHFTDKWQQRGFEISGHPDHTLEATNPRWNAMDSIYKTLSNRLQISYGVNGMKTVTNHWFVWCGFNGNGNKDFAAQAKLEELHGIGLDCNYAHYDNYSNQKHFLGASGWQQGNYTGSGLAMKFSDVNGNIIDVYQQLNNVYDQQYMEKKDKDGYFNCFKGLLDRSLNNEVYSYISVRAHNNEYFFSKEPLMKMLDYANSKSVPVWTELMLLNFLRAREEAELKHISWKKNELTFDLVSKIRFEQEITCMIPFRFNGMSIKRISVSRKPVPATAETIKGYEYALVSVKPGKTYRITVEYGN